MVYFFPCFAEENRDNKKISSLPYGLLYIIIGMIILVLTHEYINIY